MQKAAQAYLQTQVTTTSQGDLLLMLYDGAIKFLKQAKVKMQEQDYAQKGILISRAMDVIAELASSLNAQKGGDLADNLNKLYFYCNTKLLQANLKMDTGLIDVVIKILSGLRDAFAQISDTVPTAEDIQAATKQNAPKQEKPVQNAAPQPQDSNAAPAQQAPQQKPGKVLPYANQNAGPTPPVENSTCTDEQNKQAPKVNNAGLNAYKKFSTST